MASASSAPLAFVFGDVANKCNLMFNWQALDVFDAHDAQCLRRCSMPVPARAVRPHVSTVPVVLHAKAVRCLQPCLIRMHLRVDGAVTTLGKADVPSGCCAWDLAQP